MLSSGFAHGRTVLHLAIIFARELNRFSIARCCPDDWQSSLFMGILILTSLNRTTRKCGMGKDPSKKRKDAAGALNYFSCSLAGTLSSRPDKLFEEFCNFSAGKLPPRIRIFEVVHPTPSAPPHHRVDKLGGFLAGRVPPPLGGKLHLFLEENFARRNNESSSVFGGPRRMARRQRNEHILAASANKLERKNTLFCSSHSIDGGCFLDGTEKTDSWKRSS